MFNRENLSRLTGILIAGEKGNEDVLVFQTEEAATKAKEGFEYLFEVFNLTRSISHVGNVISFAKVTDFNLIDFYEASNEVACIYKEDDSVRIVFWMENYLCLKTHQAFVFVQQFFNMGITVDRKIGNIVSISKK